jgi:hypothetical protein
VFLRGDKVQGAAEDGHAGRLPPGRHKIPLLLQRGRTSRAAPRACARKDAKAWLTPEIDLVDSYGFNAGELRRILGVVREKRAELLRAWHEHFGDGRSL